MYVYGEPKLDWQHYSPGDWTPGLYWFSIPTQALPKSWSPYNICFVAPIIDRRKALGRKTETYVPEFTKFDRGSYKLPAGLLIAPLTNTIWRADGTTGEVEGAFYIPKLELKGCPFCGYSPVPKGSRRLASYMAVTAKPHEWNSFHIDCTYCRCAGTPSTDQLQSAIMMWNKRENHVINQSSRPSRIRMR